MRSGWKALLACAAAAGCVRYEPRPLEARKILEELRRVRLADAAPGMPRPDGDGPGRFDSSDGLTEGEAAAVALAASPVLRERRAALGVAESEVLAAGLFPDPEIDLSWIDRSDGSALSGSILAAVPAWRERPLRKERATLALDEHRARVAAAEWSEAAAVRRAFAELVAAREGARVLSEALALRNRIADLLRARREGGAASPLESELADLEAARLRRRLREEEGRADLARQAVNRRMGLPPPTPWEPQADVSYWTAPPIDLAPDRLEEEAIARRADLRAAALSYARAERDLALACLGQRPRLRLGPAYEREEGESGWGIGAAIELPLWSRNRGEIAERTAERGRLALAFVAAVSSVRADLAAARLSFSLADAAAREDEREIAPRLAACAAMVEEGIRAGKLDATALSLVTDRILEARLDAVSARLARRRALIQMEEAIGAGIGSLGTAK